MNIAARAADAIDAAHATVDAAHAAVDADAAAAHADADVAAAAAAAAAYATAAAAYAAVVEATGGGVAQGVNESLVRPFSFRDSSHHMDIFRVRRCRICNRLVDRGTRLLGPARNGGQPICPRVNITATRIQPEHSQTCLMKRRSRLLVRCIEGPVTFHGGKSSRLGGAYRSR